MTDTLFGRNSYILSNRIQYAIHVSPSFKFFKAENLFVIVIWYFSLTSPSLNFFYWIIRIRLVHTSLAHCQSLPNFCSYEIVVSITISPSEKSNIKHNGMPSSVY
jgi:hypothetical protein